MSDKVFVDTNVLIYFVADDIKKKNIAKDLLMSNERIVISTQVITEFVAVTIKKQILSEEKTMEYAGDFMDIFNFAIIRKETINSSFKIKGRYGYSIWDSLIIAAAIENNCEILYTEDMADGIVIDDTLRLQNPFV